MLLKRGTGKGQREAGKEHREQKNKKWEQNRPNVPRALTPLSVLVTSPV